MRLEQVRASTHWYVSRLRSAKAFRPAEVNQVFMNRSRAIGLVASAMALPAIPVVAQTTPTIRLGCTAADAFAQGFYAQELGYFKEGRPERRHLDLSVGFRALHGRGRRRARYRHFEHGDDDQRVFARYSVPNLCRRRRLFVERTDRADARIEHLADQDSEGSRGQEASGFSQFAISRTSAACRG